MHCSARVVGFHALSRAKSCIQTPNRPRNPAYIYIYMRVYIQTSVSISNVLAMGTVTGSHVRATISDLECRAIEAVIVRIGYL